MNEQLQQFISQVASSARGLRVLTALVEDLLASSCGGLGAKLAEYAPRGPDGAPSLIAELRMALRVSAAVGLPVQLQAGAESDLRVRLPSGVDLTIEVEHKSASSAYGAVFHPEPDVLAEYATSQVRWKQAAWRLHEALQTSPFKVQPWIGAALGEPCWSWADRHQQEERCGRLAERLVGQLRSIPRGQPTQLTDEDARFDVTPISSPPGRINGAGPLAAFIVREYPDDADPRTSLSAWLAHGIERKSKIAVADPARLGRLHLVGLVINEAFASDGYVLKNTFLGGLVADGGGPTPMRHYRPVPSARRAVLQEARERGRGYLLDLMQFDPDVPTRAGEREGLVFDPIVQRNVDGILALYYTDMLQWIPNPFSDRDIELLAPLLPNSLKPFESAASGGSA